MIDGARRENEPRGLVFLERMYYHQTLSNNNPVTMRAVLTFEEALEKILKHSKRRLPLKAPIDRSLGFVLAEEIRAREEIPLFNSSSVDGFAVRISDIKDASQKNPVRLPVQGTVSAGSASPAALKPGYTMKVMTGAPLPPKTESVVMKEFVALSGENAIFKAPTKEGASVRSRGEEFSKKEIVFGKGTVVTPPVVGMCAALGYPTIKVFRKPTIALVITGNELRSPSAVLRAGQIRDSNSFALSAALASIRIVPSPILFARDKREVLSRAFARALKRADVVISAGGVSVGDFDFVKEVLGNLRVRTIFWRVAMKPGKPNFFGVRGKKLVFGLPGNPVSAMVSLETLVFPALRKMMGVRHSISLNHEAVLTTELRKGKGRTEFVRATAVMSPSGGWNVSPTRGQGSHMIGGLAQANCMIIVPRDRENLAKGERVSIRFFSWNVTS